MAASWIVTPDSGGTTGLLRADAAVFPCILGRSGVRIDKSEGDGATPAGRFPLRRVYYRADRGPKPTTSLPVAALKPDDGWCDGPRDPLYNRAVMLPYGGRTEALWREDNLYDLIVVLGHNDSPVVPGAGSAIFMHLSAPDGRPTEGCVALAREPLVRLLAIANTTTLVEINAI